LFYPENISYCIISLGCSKNLVDSERINAAMSAAGFVAAETSEEAGIIIINTCGFIQSAKEESLSVIFDALGIRDGSVAAPGGFGRKVAAVGCLTQRYFRDIAADIPELDFVYGIYDDGFVPALCTAFDIAAQIRPIEERKPLTPGLSYAYIKIADGCSNNCSYCAIPLIRGPHRSFSPEFIIGDAARAVASGAKELVIVAQDIAAYRYKDTGLPELVDMIARIDGVRWIRLLYCHPDHCDGRIIGLLKSNPLVVPYIDLPFQHASARILASMGRKGSRQAYLDLVKRLREEVPGIRIRSTFMVGYPGETDGDFNELISFLKEAELDRVGAFAYSPEEGTPAAGLGETVPAKVKRRRLDRLMALQRRISARKLGEMVDREVDVLVEDRLDDGTFIGRTPYDAPEVDGIFYLTGGGAVVNSIARARVTDSVEYDLFGIVL